MLKYVHVCPALHELIIYGKTGFFGIFFFFPIGSQYSDPVGTGFFTDQQADR
jgi:hypothetical protein